jgi:glycine/D-amino acid oxidase-like deaminating enzyme
LQKDMLAVYPYLHGVPIEYAWGGTLDFTHDWMPHAGRLDGMYYAAGYAGHGVALATYLGTLAGQAMSGEMVDNPFAEITLPQAPLGLHYLVRPLLPAAAAWLKIKDRLS